jgi:hypothetical protein
VDDISDENLLEAYTGGLKEDIKHDLFLRYPTNIMEAMQFSHHIQDKNKATHKYTIGVYTCTTDEEHIVLEFIRKAYLNQQG